jgi:serine/threonine protein kinase
MEKPEAQIDIEGAIFEVALSIEDPAARRGFLERAFREDAGGLAKMMALLESADDATSFFLEAREVRGHIASELFGEISEQTAKAVTTVPASDRIGSSIGNYHLVRCLGEGGSGVVYEAEQHHPVRRRVALKIIRVDAGGESVGARFDIERQALAIMDHPNIAKVLDAGGIHEGSPYFVMELVDGEPITSYCDREKFNIARRIRLFIDVCGAIQHAHSKRIIHRDIKPSNVLVTVQDGRPVAKVIDFGIAKTVARDFKREAMRTAHDQFIGTPVYMSPEQVEMIGVDVDTRSDVYSLGVLLYELLTSLTPFDRRTLVDSGMAVMRRTLLDKRHPKPSSKLSEIAGADAKIIAGARRTEPARLLASIRGDLDWIVMKALEKDRNRRYETANDLAADLGRYLDDKPVAARRPNNLYTLGKFIRRNRIPFYSAVAVAISILLGFGASTTLYLRERTALNEQERLSVEAGRSRDQELHLRRQAQARANVSRVAFLLSEGHVKEADELLQGNPLVSIEPSREASSVFRVLGNWYATYGRWEDAVQCFRLMGQATTMNSSSEILRSADLLVSAPALLEFGDRSGYEKFREQVLARHLPVKDSLEAEHILKACLLTKPSPEFLQQLEPAALLCEQSIEGRSKSTFPAWEAFSLTLYHYRKGNFEEVLRIGNRGLAAPEIKDICAACIRALTAVANHRLGNEEASVADLKWAASIVRKVRTGDSNEEKVIMPRWYDWSVAAVLLKEAEITVRPPAHKAIR